MGTHNDSVHEERETLLRSLADRLQNRGYEDLRVSRLEQFEGKRPDIIFWKDTDIGFMPDVSAVKSGVAYIFQVETERTLQSEDARRRIALFSAYAHHYRRHYCLVVSEEALVEATGILLSQECDERFVHVVPL